MDLMALVVYKGIAIRVLLPISIEELAERFGYEGEDIEVTIDSIEALPDLDCEGLTLDLANKLAKRLENVDENLVLTFIERKKSNALSLLNADFEGCWLYPDVNTYYELGKHTVEEDDFNYSIETLKRYFDYEKYGRDIRFSQGGSFVDKGYFVSR